MVCGLTLRNLFFFTPFPLHVLLMVFWGFVVVFCFAFMFCFFT